MQKIELLRALDEAPDTAVVAIFADQVGSVSSVSYEKENNRVLIFSDGCAPLPIGDDGCDG